MKYFNVTVMEKGKKRLELTQAESRMDAVKIVKSKFPNSLVTKAVETAAPLEDSFEDLIKGFKKYFKAKIPINDKVSSIRQIAVMTDAGISITDTLKDVGENTTNPGLKEIYSKMNSDINAGNTMVDAMRPYTDEFGHIALAMTDLGERTGNVSEAYHKLADILETIRDNNKKFKKAIRSPMITLTAMAGAFMVLIMVVVPKFKDIFSRFKTDLPVPTQILLNLEWAFSNFGIYIVIAFAGLISFVKFSYKNNDDFKFQMDKLMIHPKFFMINQAIFLSTMHKYNLVFGELVKSGIPVAEALDTAVGMVTNMAIKEKLLGVNANISRGMSLGEALDETKLYENMLLQMIRAGEAGGQLDAMLDKVTEYYDMRFQAFIDGISAMIEPIMGVFVAGLVLLMALGIFMPMWDLGKAVG